MNIQVENLEILEKSGVYKILNTINGKYYIGSTKQSLKIRLNHHINALKRGTHKNTHLQHAWNKYGENAFLITILEICDKNIVYEREQYYLNNRNVELSYNINPRATGPSLNKETISKQVKSRKKFNKECNVWYKKYKNKEITLNEIPKKFIATIMGRNHYVWNKGKTMESTDHLKVKHKMTPKLQSKYKQFSEHLRNTSDIIYVYDSNKIFINRFRSSKDLADLSIKLNLPLKSRFSKARGNSALNELQSCNINRAVKTQKPYKGLYFTNVPLHPGMDDVNEPISVKNWNVNTEINIENKKSISSYSIETEPAKAE